MSKPFTKEQNAWLVDNFRNYSNYAELTSGFNEKFGTNYTWAKTGYYPIERRCRRMGLKRYETEYGFNEEEDAWLKEYAPRFSSGWLSKNIVFVSGRNHSSEAIKMHVREWLGIRKGNGGIREDTVQTYKKSIGSITSWGSSQTRIKIHDTGDDRIDWYPYGRYVYENHYNVKLPSNVQIIHLDGDNTNFDIKNLCAVTHQEHAILSANDWHSCGEITRTASVWARLYILMKNDEKRHTAIESQ